MGNNARVGIEIPETLISDTVRAEVMRAISEKEAHDWISAIVGSAFAEKDKSSYGRRTVFESACQKMITDLAEEVFAEWLEENKPRVREAMLKHLNAYKGRGVKRIVDALVDGTTRFSLSVNLKGPSS